MPDHRFFSFSHTVAFGDIALLFLLAIDLFCVNEGLPASIDIQCIVFHDSYISLALRYVSLIYGGLTLMVEAYTHVVDGI